jgi:hypothetical protein
MHWRGDRVDGFFGTDPCTEPTGAPCNEDLSFRNFIVAFEGLVGKDGNISGTEMQQFTDFVLQIMMPPNPVRALDNSLTADQQDGLDLFNGPTTDTVATCDGCHRLDPSQGFFGSGGEQSFEGEPQTFKVAQMRNMYAKVGMFGDSNQNSNMGDQVRGFGFLHDGSVDTVDTFLKAGVFNLSNAEESDLEQFSLAFPTDLAPVVGQQVTLTSTNSGDANPRIDLLIQRAGTSFTSLLLGGTVTECDLVVKGTVGGEERGWVREAGGLFRDDTNGTIADAALRALATTEGPLTYTCAPPGSGVRMGINRDGDLFLDGLDNCPGVANDSQTDTDMNGVGDDCEAVLPDGDGDGFADVVDNCPITPNPMQLDFDMDGDGDACDADDDNDGLDDVVETDTDIFVSGSNTGTDPLDADSDDDGHPDGAEVFAGTDPNDPNSFPVAMDVPALQGLAPALLVLVLGAVGVVGARRGRGLFVLLLVASGVGLLAVGPARAGDLALELGQSVEIAASDVADPVVLRFELPTAEPVGSSLSARVIGPAHKVLETRALVSSSDGHELSIELPAGWIGAGRHLVEVRTSEKTHFPLRRYAFEVR